MHYIVSLSSTPRHSAKAALSAVALLALAVGCAHDAKPPGHPEPATAGLLGLGLAALILWSSRPRLASFGPGYEAALPALVIAVAAAFLSILGRAPIAVIARAEMERRLLVVSGVDFAVLLVVGAVLGGPFGMTGVAVALLCSTVTRITIAVVSVRRRYELKTLGIV